MLPDEEFLPGALEYLVEGNQCRLLDGRRTPGFIEKVFYEYAMFRWRITAFEHKGKYWDLPAEWAERAQFASDSLVLAESEVQALKRKIVLYSQELLVEADPILSAEADRKLPIAQEHATQWLKENSSFFRRQMTLDFTSRTGSEVLAGDLKNFLDAVGLLELEELTAETYVLNPNSGEWIKGIEIMMAEMGLVTYRDKHPRTPDIFDGLGAKDLRIKYIIHRIAFVRAYFHLLGIDEVVLYRGMKTETELKNVERRFISCSFDIEVARELANFERDPRFRNSALAKFVLPVERLWMTYLETAEMNHDYKEAEAVILASDEAPLMW